MPSLLLPVLVALLVCALLDFLLQRAPFIGGDYKAFARYVVIVACVVWIVWIVEPGWLAGLRR